MTSSSLQHPLRDDLDYIVAHTRDLWDDVRGCELFLTGGTGFVGTWLVESFAWANRALALDAGVTLLTRSPERFRALSPHLANDRSVTILHGNIAEPIALAGPCAYVIHAAIEAPCATTPSLPLGAFERDLAGVRTVLDFARRSLTRRLLFTSSGAVYGKQPPELENVPEEYCGAPGATDARALYAHAKRVSELACTMYAETFGFTSLIARLFAFVGPHLPLRAGYAAGNFVADLLEGADIRMTGDGTSCRSYLYAADLAIWLWTILLRGETGRPYNVGSPLAITIGDLAERIAAMRNPRAQVCGSMQLSPHTAASSYVPSTLRAERELGLSVGVPLDDALRKTIAWHRMPGAHKK